MVASPLCRAMSPLSAAEFSTRGPKRGEILSNGLGCGNKEA